MLQPAGTAAADVSIRDTTTQTFVKDVIEESRRQPVLVDFWAPWCGPCRMMEPITESLAKDYKVCKVNVDSNTELATQYQISSIPRLMIFRDGEKVFEIEGVTSEAELRAELKKLARK